jgi:hypothetical protein
MESNLALVLYILYHLTRTCLGILLRYLPHLDPQNVKFAHLYIQYYSSRYHDLLGHALYHNLYLLYCTALRYSVL